MTSTFVLAALGIVALAVLLSVVFVVLTSGINHDEDQETIPPTVDEPMEMVDIKELMRRFG
jgi:hypothetical protein